MREKSKTDIQSCQSCLTHNFCSNFCLNFLTFILYYAISLSRTKKGTGRRDFQYYGGAEDSKIYSKFPFFSISNCRSLIPSPNFNFNFLFQLPSAQFLQTPFFIFQFPYAISQFPTQIQCANTSSDQPSVTIPVTTSQ